MIEVTGVDLRRFARKVYQLSQPTNRVSAVDSMSDTSMGVVLKNAGVRNWKKYVLDMHIVQGRACNMTVFENNQGRWFIHDTWSGHTKEQLYELLEHCGITPGGGNNDGQSQDSAASPSEKTATLSPAGNGEKANLKSPDDSKPSHP